MKIKYLITDVDGTIFDTMPAIFSAFAKAMAPRGLSEKQVADWLTGSLGAPMEHQIKGMMAQAGRQIDENGIRQAIDDFKAVIDERSCELFPGVKESLLALKDKGILLMASSGSGSGSAKLERRFREHGLPYDFAVGSDKILKGDGHIDVFARRFSLAKTDFCRQAAFVGDGTTDMEIAARNGIFGIGITNTIPAQPLIAAGAKAVIGNFEEILGLVE
ncbi:MAG: HAD hydrolase-like protein [Candidatus Pacebacteria bacterium]|jgi:phosphoglycolate phosphatase-like HAD superfamily hydrolase|nr:HAD hydrolase-like protein [Candidatus Paceibacterota bacterium]